MGLLSRLAAARLPCSSDEFWLPEEEVLGPSHPPLGFMFNILYFSVFGLVWELASRSCLCWLDMVLDMDMDMVLVMDMDMDMVDSGVHGVPELRAVSCAFVVTWSVFSRLLERAVCTPTHMWWVFIYHFHFFVCWPWIERRLYRNTFVNKLVEQFMSKFYCLQLRAASY